MVTIKVRNLDILKEITGEDVCNIQFENEPSINDVLHRMRELYGKEFSRRVFENDNDVSGAMSVVINNDEVLTRSGFDRRLLNNTMLTILLPIAGG